MITYDQIYVGENEREAEKLNLLNPSLGLEKAKQESDSFILLSSPLLFDRSVGNVYTESSAPTCSLPWAIFLQKMEEKVLAYEHGYVFRVQDPFEDLCQSLYKMAALGGEITIPSGAISPLSYDAFCYLKRFCLTDGIHLVHFATGITFDWASICYALRPELPFLVDDENVTVPVPSFLGFLQSDVLKKMYFYEGMVRENKNIIIEEIRSIAAENQDGGEAEKEKM